MSVSIVKLVDNPITITMSIMPKGAYNAGTSYSIGDSVSYGGSSYVAISGTTGNLPTNTTYWQVLSEGVSGSITAYAPLYLTANLTTNDLTISQAGATTDGYVSTADWNTFNNKTSQIDSIINALIFG